MLMTDEPGDNSISTLNNSKTTAAGSSLNGTPNTGSMEAVSKGNGSSTIGSLLDDD